ncbi:MAG: serine--tRNA ligase [bacterium]|nr:serine--tRNA ligase [bacterium]
MLELKFIRENLEAVKKNCIVRNVKVDIDKILEIDESRKAVITEIDALRAERNQKSKGKPSPEEIIKMRTLGDTIKAKEQNLTVLESELKELWMQVPNMTHSESPVGGEGDYRVVFQNREPEPFAFTPKDHEELMIKNDLVDFERATKVSGAKFYFFKNNQVRLNQALINYGLDVIGKHGYTIIETPDLAKNSVLEGIGFNPRGTETQVYSIEGTDLSLVGTAEITMGGYHADEILDLSNGPKKYVALSHCFRTEAGSYGRTSKGLYRVHQFTKVEMFVYCKPEDSEKLHSEIMEIEKEILTGLEIPFRFIDIPTGDLGGPAYRKYDGEAWMTMKGENGAQGDYGEVTSCSNCTDYQSRRLNIKYRKDDGTTEYVHTLNGTGVVMSRFPIAIAENYQEADGSIRVPKVLQKYCGLEKL